MPQRLPRIETVLDIESRTCSCCGSALHAIGDVAERLDVIPAQFRVLVVRRPKYACRACPGTVVQAPAPPRLIEGGLPTEGLIAHVIVGKYATTCRSIARHISRDLSVCCRSTAMSVMVP